MALLESLETKTLVERLYKYEEELETAFKAELEYKRYNSASLAGHSSDCRAVEEILAALDPPEELGKLTVDQRKAWLMRQRKENSELKAAIELQHHVAFNNEQNSVATQMIAKRLEGVKAVMALRTAQIRFLVE